MIFCVRSSDMIMCLFFADNIGYDDCHIEMRGLQPNPLYAQIKDEGPSKVCTVIVRAINHLL